MAEPFLAAARRHPDRLAVVHGDVALTYAEVARRIDQVARVLLARGVHPGDRVAYLLPNGRDLIELYYAVQRIGAVAVPINFRCCGAEIAYLLRASGSTVLVFPASCTERVDEARAEVPGLRDLLCTDAATPWAACLTDLAPAVPDAVPDASDASDSSAGRPDGAGRADPPWPELWPADPEAVSRIQYTGGSTGVPKGVERTHAADLVEIEGTYLSNGLDTDETKIVLIQCPLEHHGGHDWFCMSFACGATVVLVDRFRPEVILDAIERHRVSYMILLPPTTYARLMDHPTIDDHDLSSVRLVQSSAGATTPEIVRRMYRHFPQARVLYGWGQTESGLGTSLVLTREMAEQEQPRIASIGRPQPHLELRIVDEQGAEVGPGVVGEGVVRSAAVMRGYHEQPELTCGAFTPDGWLRTGDMMERDADGYLYLRSRKRDLVKSGGENVFVGEVEGVVRAHPAVRDALVHGVPDPRLGEAVAVAVELVPGATLTLAELQDFCRARMASYKKPRHLEVLESLGRDYSGKVDRTRVLAESARRRDLRLAGEDVCTQVSIDPDVYRVALPLDEGFEATTCCYVLPDGEGGGLVVDPGADGTASAAVLRAALDRLGVDLGRSRVLVTHEHSDHLGAAARLAGQGYPVLAGAALVDLLGRWWSEPVARACTERFAAEGFGSQEVADFERLRTRAVPAVVRGTRGDGGDRSDGSDGGVPIRPLADGDRLRVGRYDFTVLATPGHSPGHVCLYQEDRRLLLSGDHVLFHLSPPVLGAPDAGRSALTDHLASLDRVAGLEVDRCLPGHGEPQGDPSARVAGLRRHHERRLAAVLDLVADGCTTGAGVARTLRWSAAPGPWDRTPEGLRWLIATETVGYLDHLVERGDLHRTTGPDGRVAYAVRAATPAGPARVPTPAPAPAPAPAESRA
ncbi:MAG TPA: AMP-binding protein [Cellulomonas sp.]